MKYLLLIPILFLLTSCAMGDPSIRLTINTDTLPVTLKHEKIYRAGEIQSIDPSVNNPTSALSSNGGVTIIIKQQTVETNTPLGINATIPASSLGGL